MYCISTQTEIESDAYEILDLKSRLEIQCSTLKTMKILLGHARDENEQLQLARCRSAGPSRKPNNQRLEDSCPPIKLSGIGKNSLQSGSEMAQEVCQLFKLQSLYDAKVVRLQRELRRKDETLTQLKSVHECKFIENSALLEKVTRIKQELEEVVEKLAFSEKKVSSLSSALNKRRIECKDLAARLSSSVSMEEHQSQKNMFQRDIEKLSIERDELRDKSQCLSQEVSAAKDQHEKDLNVIQNLENIGRLAEGASVEASASREKLLAHMTEKEEEHSRDLKSLKKSHALAISLLEQTAGNEVLKAESRMKDGQAKLLIAEKHVTRLLKEIDLLRFELNTLTSSRCVTRCVSVQAVADMETLGSQCENIIPRTKGCQTDNEADFGLMHIVKDLSCGSCMKAPSNVLFPCGHCLCEVCTTALVDEESINVKGITCPHCKDNLPITTMCKWKAPEVLCEIIRANI